MAAGISGTRHTCTKFRSEPTCRSRRTWPCLSRHLFLGSSSRAGAAAAAGTAAAVCTKRRWRICTRYSASPLELPDRRRRTCVWTCRPCARLGTVSAEVAASRDSSCAWRPAGAPAWFFTRKINSGGRGGGARTDTDGHGRARPTRTSHPIHRQKPSTERPNARRVQGASSADHRQSSISERRDQYGRASPLSHAQSAGARYQGAASFHSASRG